VVNENLGRHWFSSPVNADHPRAPAGASADFVAERVWDVVRHGTSVRHPISEKAG
jgi:hypothetical protein